MTTLQQVILLVIILVVAAIMGVLQMWSGEAVPAQFWTVVYAILGFLGIPVAVPLAVKGAKRVGRVIQ